MSWWVQVQTPRPLLLLLPEHLGSFGFVWNMVVSDESEGVGVSLRLACFLVLGKVIWASNTQKPSSAALDHGHRDLMFIWILPWETIRCIRFTPLVISKTCIVHLATCLYSHHSGQNTTFHLSNFVYRTTPSLTSCARSRSASYAPPSPPCIPCCSESHPPWPSWVPLSSSSHHQP